MAKIKFTEGSANFCALEGSAATCACRIRVPVECFVDDRSQFQYLYFCTETKNCPYQATFLLDQQTLDSSNLRPY